MARHSQPGRGLSAADAVVGRQRPFLCAQRGATGGGTPHRRSAPRWADAYAALTRAGYGRPDELGRMTERQLLLHFAAVQRMERRERAARLVDMNLAFAGGKDASAHLQTLHSD